MNNINPTFLYIDLFCGFGGTTLGLILSKVAKVIACVNHDPKAIKSHWMNHTDVKHFEEDIRLLDLTELVAYVLEMRKLYPNAKLVIWASLECTNFSKAKGGQARNADSRTLAEHLIRYILALDPDYIQIENVVEFMSWGPLDEKGKPISRKNGRDWIRWRQSICDLGYHDDWKELNSANFGAYTSRNRLFGCFAKEGLPIKWPTPTHAKSPVKSDLFSSLDKWKPVKEVLDFQDEGKSIFDRDKPLSDRTLERIYAGLIKFVANGDKSFLSKYYSGKPEGKNISTDQPAGTLTCIDSHALVQTHFLLKYNSTNNQGKHFPPSVEEPCPVVTTQNRLGLIQTAFMVQRNSGNPESKLVDINTPARTLTSTGGNQELIQTEFLQHYYGNGFNTSTDEPCPTITTKERAALVKPKYFIKRDFTSGGGQHSSIDEPAGSILRTPKMDLMKVEPFVMNTNFNNVGHSIDEPAHTITANRKWHYLVNPSYGGNVGSMEEPCWVIVARQDKSPLYLACVESGHVAVAVYEADSPIMVKIKEFMAIFGLVDIKMRMLRVPELLRIQGFPDTYKMVGNQTDHKKFIGNSVVPHVVEAWAKAMDEGLKNYFKMAA